MNITADHTEVHKININETIMELKISHHLNDNTTKNLKCEEAKTPEFKMAPKFIKKKIQVDL